MRSKRTVAAIGPLAAVLLLAGCGDEQQPIEADDGRSATGEVLEGTISDAMIATDTLRSQAPLAEIAESGDAAAGTTRGESGPADVADPAQGEAEPSGEGDPAPEPDPEPAED